MASMVQEVERLIGEDQPESQGVNKGCEALEDSIRKLLAGDKSDASTAAPSSPAPSLASTAGGASELMCVKEEQEEPPSSGWRMQAQRVENALKESAAQGGSFKTRGSTLGNAWAKALRDSPALNEQYKQVKGLPEKEKFRAAWVMSSWKEVSRKRAETRSQIDISGQVGDFDLLKNIFKAQGGDAEAAEGILTFVRKVMTLPVVDRSKYISVHPWTDRLELALPKRGWQEKDQKRWDIQKCSEAPPTHASQTSQSSGQSGKGVAGSANAEPQTEVAQPEVNTKGNKRPRKQQKAEDSPDTKHAKTVEAWWKKAVTTKASVRKALSAARTVLSKVENDPKWSWMKTLDELASLSSCVCASERFQQSQPFWHEFCMLSRRLPGMKKKFSAADVETEVRDRCPTLDKDAKEIHGIAEMLRRLQAERCEVDIVVD